MNLDGSGNRGPVTVQVFATANGSPSVVLATVTRRVNLRAGGTATAAVRVAALPAAAGTYAVSAAVTDPAGVVATAAGVVATAAGPTLTVAATTVMLSLAAAPATGAAGKPVVLRLTLANAGNTAAAGTASVSVTLTSTTAAVPYPTVTRPVRAHVRPVGSVVVRVRYDVPVAVVAGTYGLAVTADLGGAVATATGLLRVR